LNILKGFGFGNRSMESTISEEAQHFVSFLEQERGSPVCLISIVNKAVANVVCSIVLGKRFGYSDEEFCKFIHTITETVVNKYIPKVNLLPILRWIPTVRKSCQHCEDQNVAIREWFQRQIDAYKTNLDENNIQDFIDAFMIEIRTVEDDSNSQFTGNRYLKRNVVLFKKNVKITPPSTHTQTDTHAK
jgi:cytochrome P450 family 2 subfamily U polypeptide 1